MLFLTFRNLLSVRSQSACTMFVSFVACFLVVFPIFSTSIKVDLPLGGLEGSEKLSFSRRIYYAFEGVPYARPPIGKHRFREPVPLKPWSGTIVANTVTKCMQYNHYTEPGEDWVVGDEDCLYLNIYTPDPDMAANLDVIVYIHGGAFMFNYAALYRPDFLMDRDLVFVTFNYRLGPLGFLTTESDLMPGNNGLKDQILALQWVKSYIEFFGGNPNSITLVGNSAGGASVHLHTLLPKSRQLFNRAWAQSGTALNPWVLMENGADKFLTVATAVGCNSRLNRFNEVQIVDCLKKRPARQIVATVKQFQPFLYNPFSPFGIVVDGQWSLDPVLQQHPYLLLKTGKIHNKPIIFSHTSAEGLYPFADFYKDGYLDELNRNWNQLLPHILDYNFTVDPLVLNDVSTQIRRHYLGSENLTQDKFADFVQIGTDRIFVHDIQKAAKLHSANSRSPAYFYYFTYRGAHSKSERTGANLNFGASHADDPCYLLKCEAMDVTTTDEDRKVTEVFLDLLASFAASGRPKVTNVTWPKLDRHVGKITRLVINSGNDLQVDSVDYAEVADFWDALPLEENEKLVGPVREEL